MTPESFLYLFDPYPRASGRGWMTRCPAHEDRTASLSIGVGQEGQILLTCFAGCSVHEITSALGIELSDLFPPKIETYVGPAKPVRHLALDILRAIELEARIVLVAAGTLADGKGMSVDDFARLELAEDRIAEALQRACA